MDLAHRTALSELQGRTFQMFARLRVRLSLLALITLGSSLFAACRAGVELGLGGSICTSRKGGLRVAAVLMSRSIYFSAPGNESLPREAWLPQPGLRWQPCGGGGARDAGTGRRGGRRGKLDALRGWAAVSAYVDTRPLAHGEEPAIVFIMAGPPRLNTGVPASGGVNFTAVVEALTLTLHDDDHATHEEGLGSNASQAAHRATPPSPPGGAVLSLRCLTPPAAFPGDVHGKPLARRLLRCLIHRAAWDVVVRLARVAACVVDDVDANGPGARFAGGCPPGSAVPVGTLHNFPGYPLPAGQRLLDDHTRRHGGGAEIHVAPPSPPSLTTGLDLPASRRTADAMRVDIAAHVAGIGRTALCVAPVRGDLYASSLGFFLEYYMATLSVDMVFVYMLSPGPAMLTATADMVAAGGTGGRPAVTLVPWCITSSASYEGCRVASSGEIAALRDDDIHYFAQTLQLQDCMYRAMGAYRWVLNIDLDEYLLPPLPAHNGESETQVLSPATPPDTLAALIQAQRSLEGGSRPGEAVLPAPAEVGFRASVFAAGCPVEKGRLPLDVTVRVELAPSLRLWGSTDWLAAAAVPFAAWALLGRPTVYDYGKRSKYAYDPLLAGALRIHSIRGNLCNQHARAPPWPMPCAASMVVAPELALLANVRLPQSAPTVFGGPADCAIHDLPNIKQKEVGHFVLDWSLTNWWLTRHPDGQSR
jgi:hypothetical protein